MVRVNLCLVTAVLAMASPLVRTAGAEQPAPKTTVIRAGRLIDTRGGRVLNDQHIVI